MSDDEDDNTPLPPMLREDADATLYKYRDFALVVDADNDCEPSAQSQANRSLESSIRVQKFPVKLYSILAQKEFSDIITWMPHGRSWKVLKPNLFESLVMPLFFEYSNYHSFNRLVNAWSFRRISSGSDRGSYYHELFLRGKPHLQKYMRRLPKTHKKLPMRKQDEPDFYKLDKTSTLPALHDTSASNSLNANPIAIRPRPGPGAAAAVTSGGIGTNNTLPSGFAGNTAQQIGQIAQLSHPGQPTGLVNGGGAFGFNKNGKDATNSMGGMHGMGVLNGLGGLNGMSAMNGMVGMSGMNMNGMGGMNGMGNLGNLGNLGNMGNMGNMGSMGSMGSMGNMGSMNGMNSTNGMNGMSGLGSIGGLSENLRSPTLGGLPAASLQGGLGAGDLIGAGPVPGGSDNQLFQLQRLRHLQHLQLFQRQIGSPSLGGADDLARLQAEHALGLR